MAGRIRVSKMREGMSEEAARATHPGEEAAEVEPAPETEADTGECVHGFQSVTMSARARRKQENLIAHPRRPSRKKFRRAGRSLDLREAKARSDSLMRFDSPGL